MPAKWTTTGCPATTLGENLAPPAGQCGAPTGVTIALARLRLDQVRSGLAGFASNRGWGEAGALTRAGVRPASMQPVHRPLPPCPHAVCLEPAPRFSCPTSLAGRVRTCQVLGGGGPRHTRGCGSSAAAGGTACTATSYKNAPVSTFITSEVAQPKQVKVTRLRTRRSAALTAYR